MAGCEEIIIVAAESRRRYHHGDLGDASRLRRNHRHQQARRISRAPPGMQTPTRRNGRYNMPNSMPGSR